MVAHGDGIVGRIQDVGVDIIKIESSYHFDGRAGYFPGQGQ
jgi:hypothetical protein